jgi:hypothetical protein
VRYSQEGSGGYKSFHSFTPYVAGGVTLADAAEAIESLSGTVGPVTHGKALGCDSDSTASNVEEKNRAQTKRALLVAAPFVFQWT